MPKGEFGQEGAPRDHQRRGEHHASIHAILRHLGEGTREVVIDAYRKPAELEPKAAGSGLGGSKSRDTQRVC